MKKVHYLAGLPRSGNTLLSSILNQNPEIYSSPLSPVCDYLWSFDGILSTHENIVLSGDRESSFSVIKNIFNNYYSDIDKSIIFDRNKYWGLYLNAEIIKKYINTNPKIVLTVRPILEILASYISILPKTDSYLDNDMLAYGWPSKPYLSTNDNRCDFLMRAGGEIDRLLYSIVEAKKPENKDNYLLVEYQDLVDKPKETMDSIYNFIGLNSYDHNFGNIKKNEISNDLAIGLPQGMHKIRQTLSKKSISPEKVLSEYVMTKYSQKEFWN
jgi:sulfotransferase